MVDHNTPFIGRSRELEDLKLLLARNDASLVVIKGRRRIGKSRLIEEFARERKFLRFEGVAPTRKTTAQAQRNEFARQLHKQLGISTLADTKDWGTLFTVLAQATKNEKVIILFDEISWMGTKDPVFLGKLKIVWDQEFKKNPNLILILCGSLSAWIEKNIISSTGFIGRISLKLTIRELFLNECNMLLESRGFKGSAQEKFMALAVTGGVPWYLELINPSIPVSENIRKLCFEPDGVFVDEFKFIFHDLFKKRLPVCKKIIEFLQDESKSYEEIVENIKYPSGGPLSEYLDDLITSGFIERDYNWSLKTGKDLRTSKFRIKDNYLRYYLKYIHPNKRKIQQGLFRTMSPLRLPGWDGIMGLQFENLVLNNRTTIWKNLGIDVADIVFENPYFQTQSAKNLGCQIDYMIQTRFNTLYVFEIKFSHHPISMGVIKEMQTKVDALQYPKGFAVIPVLIHINGVTEAVENARYFAKIIDFTKNLSWHTYTAHV